MRWAQRLVASLVVTFLLVPAVVGTATAIELPQAPKSSRASAVRVSRAAASATRIKSWDARLRPYVDFIEEERGLKFKRLPDVELLDERAFQRSVAARGGLTKDELEELARTEGQFRAIGLADDSFDLRSATQGDDDQQTLGFYDPELERLVVRGEDLGDVGIRAVVVHELMHALQDQRFNFDKLEKRTKTSGEVFALAAVFEGDATAVELAYVDTLSGAEQDEFYGANVEGELPPEAFLPASIPAALGMYYQARYSLGLSFSLVLDAQGGSTVRDLAFTDGIRSEEQILDPVAWDERQRPLKVAAPKLKKGEKRNGPADEFGPLTLYLMLAAQLDAPTALGAVTGWGGDRYQGFRRDGKECIKAVFEGDTLGDTEQIAAALQAWVATRPAGLSSANQKGDVVEFSTCEVADAPVPDNVKLAEAFRRVLNFRIFTTANLMEEFQIKVGPARCIADGLAIDAAFRELQAQTRNLENGPDDLPPAENDRYFGTVEAAFTACSVPYRPAPDSESS